MKKIILLILLFMTVIMTGCSNGFEFTSYENITIKKNYLLDTNTFEEVLASETEKEEVFGLINDLKLKERNDVALDIKGYIYQIIIDEKEISFVNGEFVYFEEDLYQITSGQEKLILFLESIEK